MKFEIDQDVLKQYNWRLRADNGEIIAHGESYVKKSDCEHAVGLVKKSFLATVDDRALLSDILKILGKK
jgi:uncharacterized protein YegP (UPF0339 family)